MPDNDVLVLDEVLEEKKLVAPAGLNDAQVFSYYAAEQTLKNYDLSADDILSGQTDDYADGGIDGFYTFANENLLAEDFDYSILSSGYSLDLFIMQDKRESSFAETAFDKLSTSLPVLLNVQREIDPAIYSPELIQRVSIFRQAYRVTARKLPKIRVHVIYTTKASTTAISPRVQGRADDLKTQIEQVVGASSQATITFQGPRELLDAARQQPTRILELPHVSSASQTGQRSYVGLVPIIDYYHFLSDDEGKLKKFIFESNVRDFQGKTPVNREIEASLSSEDSPSNPDFWWLNNGVTILCSHVTIAGGNFVITDPQIVNGLQTSYSLHDYFNLAPDDVVDDRLLLVKILETNDEVVRNSVIVATNSQTNLVPTAVKATEKLHRDIEDYFRANDLFYDRRKNFYKNQGKPADQIFAVTYLAQAILAIGLSEPDQARARPTTLLKREADYERIFSPRTAMPGYLWIAKVQRAVDKLIKTLDVSKEFKVHMRFHLAMLVGHRLLGDVVRAPGQLNDIFADMPDLDALLPDLAAELEQHLQQYMTENPGVPIDSVAKSREFVEYLNSHNAGIQAS